jgi:signal transduction histidine kinase/DNA-binding response OmpR family regulator
VSADDKVNILVVDDLPDKLLAMEVILQSLGEQLVLARSGREALRRVLEFDFAVILLDVNMPDMDGFETARVIRQRRNSAHTPIIFVTAFGDEIRASQGYQLGAVDYILSPVIPEVLRTKVGVFVDLFRKTEQVRRQAEERVTLAREQAARAAAEEATRRSLFLAEASTALANTLDFEATVSGLLRLAVPYLADVAAVTVAADLAGPWHSEMAWVSQPADLIQVRRLSAAEEPADDLWAAVARALASGEVEVLAGLETTCPGDPGGTARRLGSAAVLPLRARGRTLGVLSLGRGRARGLSPADVTLAGDLAGRAAVALDNARLYRDIQESDRHKNEFLAMLAHELRNPLAPIRNAVEVLRVSNDGGTQHWARGVIDRQVRQMVRLVDDLLDISRITRGKITLQTEVVDVASVVAGAVETSRPLIDARRQHFSVDLPPEPVRTRADPSRLAQVISNLLNNSAKYTPEDGHIWLTVCPIGDEVVFRVRDDGMGIPVEMLSRVFDLFTQVDRSLDRSEGGLGIGLTLVRRLVELHGGSVSAHSEGPTKGSEFVVRLPLVTDGPPPAAGDRPDWAVEGGNGDPPVRIRTLVVDDNFDAAESLAALLRVNGHEVRTAPDGISALEVAEGFRPDVVLLDIGLPRLDGYEVARRLRLRPGAEGVRLVSLTGYGQSEDRLRSREAGFDHHLVKPVSLAVLQALFAALRPGRHADAPV